jgi:hypothetical protein
MTAVTSNGVAEGGGVGDVCTANSVNSAAAAASAGWAVLSGRAELHADIMREIPITNTNFALLFILNRAWFILGDPFLARLPWRISCQDIDKVNRQSPSGPVSGNTGRQIRSGRLIRQVGEQFVQPVIDH